MDPLHAAVHGLFHTMQYVIEEYEKAHKQKQIDSINQTNTTQKSYPNFIWVSENQRNAEAQMFKSVEEVSNLIEKGETIPDTLYRMAPLRIHEFLERLGRLDLIPKNLETLHLK